jgi:single-strand DNA-binding protein
MAGVNKVILLGNLGSDPEVRYLENGSAVARFNIATSESYTNRNGEKIEQTEWHRIELWDNLAKIAEQYLRKGNQVYIEGKLRTETWVDKEGKQREGKTVRGTALTLIGGRSDNSFTSSTQQQSPPTPPPTTTSPPKPTPLEGPDDLPF